jgi:hypothetical protein
MRHGTAASVGVRGETAGGPVVLRGAYGKRRVARHGAQGVSGCGRPGEGTALDGARCGRQDGAALARAARRARCRGVERGWLENVSQYPCLNAKISKNSNKSAQSGEYESCRSHYPLQLLQRF